MVIEKLDVVFGQTLREVEIDGKKKLEPVEGTGTVENIHVKRFKWRQRGRIFSPLKGVGFDEASVAVQIQFVSDVICESVCDAEGKLLITPDDLDDLEVWTDPRRTAYFQALARFQSPTVENVAKNSSSTVSDATS